MTATALEIGRDEHNLNERTIQRFLAEGKFFKKTAHGEYEKIVF